MKSKIAIISLLKKKLNNDWSHIYERNNLILKNIGSYDMLIFDEGNYKERDFSELLKTYPKIKFINISSDWKKNNLKNIFSLKQGYKNMCSFFATKIWKYVKDYDYIIRLDDDSFFHTDINHFVADLEKSQYDFVYLRRKVDNHKVTKKTYPLFLNEYFPEYKFLEKIALYNFYNNFQIVRVNFMLNPKVQRFLKAIEDTNNIYNLRWGDSTIWSSLAHSFGANVCQLKNIDYEHRSHKYRSNISSQHEWEIIESPLIKNNEIIF